MNKAEKKSTIYLLAQNHKCRLARRKRKYCQYVYAHGNLEDLAGFDIVCCKKRDGFDYGTERIENINAMLPNGQTVDAKLFLWHRKNFCERFIRAAGLIVSVDDKESLEYAQQKFDERAMFI